MCIIIRLFEVCELHLIMTGIGITDFKNYFAVINYSTGHGAVRCM